MPLRIPRGEVRKGRAVNDDNKPLIITIGLDEWLAITSRLTQAERVIEAARPLLTDPWITRSYRPKLSATVGRELAQFDRLMDKPEGAR